MTGWARVMVVALLGLAINSPGPSARLRAAEPSVSFEQQIQPLLSRKCLACHGVGTREGGLSLSARDGALAELDSGSHAIVPGDLESSVLLERVTATDESLRMPPKGEPLTSVEVELLRQWIAAGAEWPEHWAYRPLQPHAPPLVQPTAWPRTPVDAFVLQQLTARGLSPSAAADKRTLLRRVTFDLIGLPPTEEEQVAFLADDAADAYARVVERLLSSPHYGERWARHWMDTVHYAETHGNDQDRPRPNAWPYRDYLVRSFNDDKPYARFVMEQVAGDVLFPEDPQAIVATGFLATGPWDESSLRDIREDTLDREVARYLDRDDIVTTVMSTFTSSTVHCARCHDHKFDPIRQADYYGLQAIFASTDKAERLYDPDPAVAQNRRDLTARLGQLASQRAALDTELLTPELTAEVAAWEQSLQEQPSGWQVLEPDSFTTQGETTLTIQADHSLLAAGPLPDTDVYTISGNTTINGVTGIRLELLPDESLPAKGPGRCANGNLHLNELQLELASQAAAEPATRVRLVNPRADFDQAGWTAAMAVDNDPATAWGIHPAVGQSHAAVFEIADAPATQNGTRLTFKLEQTHGRGHLIGRLRLSVTAAPLPLRADQETLPTEIASILQVHGADRTEGQRVALAAYYLEVQLNRQLTTLPAQELVYCGTNRFQAEGSFRPSLAPRAIHVLDRGNVTAPGDVAVPGALAAMIGFAEPLKIENVQDEASRRAALAGWLVDHRNVLVWRSIVNRIWHYHFGRGLVDTPNDFGHMGSAPTHPELLDWLALDLQAHGGSLKHLHRQIVLSATYQQRSDHNAAPALVDGDNRLLWRMNRTRLDAESIRDAVLQISGKLDRTMGGPSVKQFVQSPGIHVTPKVDYLAYDIDSPGNYRRSVYRFIFRTLPDPFMESLDCADSSQLTPARNSSVTALQALAMLNNRLIVRQSEHLAARLQGEAADLPGQVERAFQRILGRAATAEESQAVGDYAARHGLANACRMLLNSNEFMFVN